MWGGGGDGRRKRTEKRRVEDGHMQNKTLMGLHVQTLYSIP